MALLVAGLGVSATAAATLDGNYRGTYSGTATGTLEFSIAGTDIAVTQPGAGSGAIVGSTISMVVGNATVNGLSCLYTGSGEVALDYADAGYGSGTWNATCAGGATGSGAWEVTRVVATPTATPSVSSSPSAPTAPAARTLSLSAKPKRLSKPGRTTLSATLSDCSAGDSISFQSRKAGAFHTLSSVTVDDACAASMKRRVAQRTVFRAEAAAGESFLGAQSRLVTVTVRR
jgi:hypothetical protein